MKGGCWVLEFEREPWFGLLFGLGFGKEKLKFVEFELPA